MYKVKSNGKSEIVIKNSKFIGLIYPIETEDDIKRILTNLKELYKRVVFNVAINNTDDHLRNHGFIFNKNGWTLSPAFDLTIGIHNKNHVLKIDETHTSLSLKEVAKLYKKFRLSELEAQEIISKTVSVIKENFDNYCHKYSLKNNEIEMLKKHFVLE